MVAIISEVYQQEYKAYGNIEVDEDFESMLPDIPQPQNDQAAMHSHCPIHAGEDDDHIDPIALTPDRCGYSAVLQEVSYNTGLRLVYAGLCLLGSSFENEAHIETAGDAGSFVCVCRTWINSNTSSQLT